MISEDLVAAKLRGCNCYIQFKDGECLPLIIDALNGSAANIAAWPAGVEGFLNKAESADYFPAGDIAVARDTIKYVKIL